MKMYLYFSKIAFFEKLKVDMCHFLVLLRCFFCWCGVLCSSGFPSKLENDGAERRKPPASAGPKGWRRGAGARA